MIIKTDKSVQVIIIITRIKNGQTLKAMNCVSQVQNLELKGTAKAIEQYVMLKEQIQRDDKIL